MGKNHNLRAQMNYAINQGARIGASKRALRGDGELGGVVVGVKHLDGLRDAGGRLAVFAKERGCKRLYDIQPDTIREYLTERSKTCSASTMEKETSYVKKLEAIVKAAMPKSDIDWGTKDLKARDFPCKTREKVKTQALDRETWGQIIKQMEPQRSNAKIALEIGGFVGLRATECGHLAYDRVHTDAEKSDPQNVYGFGYIEIAKGPEGGAKGGRPRSVPILTATDQERIRELTAGKEGYIMGKPVQGQTILKQMRIAMVELGIYSERKWNLEHSVRKAFAQEAYDIERASGTPKREALDRVNNYLGHGDGRTALSAVYVQNQW